MRLKKYLILFFSLFFLVPSFSQETPKSYDRKIKRQTKKVERLKKKHDIVLDPGESIPFPIPKSYSTDATSLRNWGIDYMQVKEFRDKVSAKEGKRNVLIVSFDTAGELTHPSLLKASIKGFSYTGEPLKDEHGHGTHVAGIIASDFTNIGICQVLVKDELLKILPAKILHNEGWGNEDEIVVGVTDILEYVQSYIDSGWFVIFTNSWGGSQLIEELVDLYKKAEAKGILVIAASGNNGSGKVGYPAAIESVISVGALQKDENGEVTRAPYSQYGNELNYVAPGSRIYSTWKTGSFAFLTGTSMATPQEAGVYALIASYWPEATAAELKAHLKKYAKDLPPDGFDVFTGYGASLIGDLLDNEPEKIGDNPDDPIDDPDEDPIRKKRTITIPLSGYDIIWGVNTFQGKNKLDLFIETSITTTGTAENGYDELLYFTEWFYSSVGINFTNPQTDSYDVAKWTIHFYEMFANRSIEHLILNVEKITVTDEEGRTFILSGEGIGANSIDVSYEDLPLLYNTN